MDPAVRGPASPGAIEALWRLLRHFAHLMGWATFAAMINAGACWAGPSSVKCARSWLGPAPRLGVTSSAAQDADLAREASRGIRDLERYLARRDAPVWWRAWPGRSHQ